MDKGYLGAAKSLTIGHMPSESVNSLAQLGQGHIFEPLYKVLQEKGIPGMSAY